MKALWTGVVASAMAFAGVVPQAAAAAGDSLSFNMVQSAGAVSCLKTTARGKVTISDLGRSRTCTLKFLTFRRTRILRCSSSTLRLHPSFQPGTKAT